MIHVITGGSGSGKSEYAENWLTQEKDKNEIFVYIATMQPFGEETLKKIERHQKMRAEKGFQTIEKYVDLHSLEEMAHKSVLLECMSNLVANEMYRKDLKSNTPEEIMKRVLDGVYHIAKEAKDFAIVTNEVGAELSDYSKETREYIRILGEINQELSRKANRVTEVVYGIPVKVK